MSGEKLFIALLEALILISLVVIKPLLSKDKTIMS